MRKAGTGEIAEGIQTERIIFSPFVPMFSHSEQRIYPLEDVPGSLHLPAEATAQSHCAQLPSVKMDCSSCNNARSNETTITVVFSIYAGR